MALNDIYEYFDDWDNTCFNVLAQRGIEPTLEDFRKFEAEVGFELPEDFREYTLHPLGGLYMEVKEDIWPRPKTNDVGPLWSFAYGFRVYSLCDKAPDWLSIRHAVKELRDRDVPDLVPFLKLISLTERYCFTPDQKIVLWVPNDEPEEVAQSFSEIVMKAIHELEERKDMKLAEGRQN